MALHLLCGAGATSRLLAIAVAMLAAAGPSAAAVYYVNNASGSGCSSGGPGTPSNPYCTISSAGTAHHAAGDTILVMPGTYRETVTVPGSGSSGDPFVYLAGGPGVIVDCADNFSSPAQWIILSGDVYRAMSVTWSPLQVFKDGVRCSLSTAAPPSLPPNSFRYVSGEGLYVNAGGGNPGAHELLVGRRNSAFLASARSWVVIDGFEATHAEGRGIRIITGCSNITVIRNQVKLSNSYGIQADNSSRITIEQNVISGGRFHGIGFTGTNDGFIRDNESYGNADPLVRRANGIYLFDADENTLSGNRLHDNQDTGMHLTDFSVDNLAFNNRSWNNGDHGYDHLHAVGTVHFNDVSSGNFKDGFSIEGDSHDTELYNCISVNNGLTTARFDLWVNDSSLVGFQSDYNIFWNSTATEPIRIHLTKYATIGAYQAATGKDPHSLQANPQFVNGPGGDFHLLPNSPAIDAADSGNQDWPASDAEGHPRSDVAGVANTGSGPIPYSDIGPLEYVANLVAVEEPSPWPRTIPRVSPNPLHDRAHLRFVLGRDSDVRVAVFDVGGRLKRTLLDRKDAKAGAYHVALDARPERGEPLHPGLYFFTIVTPDRVDRGRFVVLR
ncbi:MAG TPA: right-handed parallel beta-helix repeat-containing protein [Candidatus Eisenbacteria bacterium]|nr:right-handed parallel beta-helix repeat-containing protein [Candidatus Eisenbacteria bacterium]